MKKIVISILVFVLVYSLQSLSPVKNSIDSMWIMHTAHSIVHEGNLNLNEFRAEVKAKKRYGVRKRDNNIYNYFPYATAFFAVPFVAVFDQYPYFVAKLIPETSKKIEELRKDNIRPDSLSIRLPFEKAIASCLVAITAVVIFLTALQFLNINRSLILVVVFAFSTSSWSINSRGLWPHGPSVLMHSLIVLCLVLSLKRKDLILLVSPLLAINFFVRPTNAITVAAVSLYIFLFYREYFVRHLIYMLMAASPFILINLEVFESIMPKYFSPKRLVGYSSLPEAFFANLISPSRGIFFLSPALLFAFYAVKKDMLKFDRSNLNLLVALIICAHTFAVSSFPNWWGGHCFGARYMSDTLAYFSFLLIPFLASEEFGKYKFINVIFFVFVMIGIFFNYRGANSQVTYGWNISPENIDNNPHKVWYLSDIQAFRGL